MNHELNLALEAAAERPYDGRRVDAFADLARRAEGDRADEAAFHARLGLLDAAVMTNRFDVALATFPRLLAAADAEPGRFLLEDQLLLAFPMLLGGATCFPEVSRSRLNELGEDFARRSAAAGRHDSEIAGGLFRLAAATGDLDAAAALLTRMRSPWGGHFAECEHCRLRQEMMLPWCSDDHPAVLRLVRRLIDAELRCTRFEFCGPREALILRSLAESEEWTEAGLRSRVALGSLGAGPFWVMMPGLSLSFLARVVRRGGIPGLAVAEAAERLRALLVRCVTLFEGISPDNRMEFFTAAAPALTALADAGARAGGAGAIDVPALRFPAADPLAPLAGEAGRANPAALAAAMDAEAVALARAFDERNGNDFHLRHHARHRAFANAR